MGKHNRTNTKVEVEEKFPIKRKHRIYEGCLKRVLDFLLSLLAMILLSPFLLILIVAGAIAMHGNPFFIQKRPGKDEKIFNLIKFRTMTNKADKSGNLLPDEKRLTKYGRFLRSTSLDELPELLNILKGDLAIVGPRPLMPEYLPYYTEEERHRHEVRPGLTGLAQVNGRSFISWEEIFKYDLKYITHLSFRLDMQLIIKTIRKVLERNNIADLTLAKKDIEGQLHYLIDGKDIVLHQPLNIERKGMM